MWAVLAGLVLLLFAVPVVKNYVSVSVSLSPSEVVAGSSFTADVSVSGATSTSLNMNCLAGAPTGSYGNCNSDDGTCVRPCWPYDFSSYFLDSPNWFFGAQFFGLAGHVNSSTDFQYYTSNGSGQAGGVDFAETPSYYNGNARGFIIPNGTKLQFNLHFSSYVYSLLAEGATVGVCYNTSAGTPSISVSSADFTFWQNHSGSWWGKNWSCKLYRATTNSTDADVTITITGASPYSEAYVTVSSMCFYDSTKCTSFSARNRVIVNGVYVYPSQVIIEPSASTSNITFSPTCEYLDNQFSYSFTGNVSSSTSPGSYTVRADVASWTMYKMFKYPDTVNQICGVASDTSFPEYLGYGTATLSVQSYATNVDLYAYGSNSGSPSQKPDDHYLRGRVYVSGGTIFDNVKLYVDNSLKATYYKSSMTCGSSYCYKDFVIDMSGYADGSHTVKAVLYVNGSQRDTASKSFSYYSVGVRNVSASQAGNDNISVSFDYKGGHKSLLIYLDTESCAVYSSSSFAPSSSHDWQTYGPQSYTIPDCAKTSGTHTLGVKLCDASGLCSTDTTTVDFTFTYSYSVRLDQPTAGVKNVQTDVRGSPPSGYSEPFSITYSTDDPSATLKLLVNSSQVQSWSVTGSGTKSGSVPSTYLRCGDTTFTAELSGSSGSDQSSSTVTYVCWYASIESPKGVVDVPSADNVTVSDGTDLTLLAITDETPENVSKVVRAYMDGSPLSPVSCPSGYTDCFVVPVGGLSCGSSHTLSLEVGDGSSVYATDTSDITLNCVQKYVRIVSPSDGAVYDFNVPLSEVNIDVYLDYNGGDTLQFYLNGSPVDLPEYNGACTHTACYVLPGSQLSLGDNNLTADLLSGGDVVATDSVTFTVNLWQFIVGEEWGVTPPLLYVEEHGSHPDSCYVIHDQNMDSMVFDDQSSRWIFPIDESYVGKTVEVFCSKDSRIVFDQNYEVQGPGVQGGSPVVQPSGGGGAVTVSPTVAYPVFPERRHVAHYIYSLYHFSGVAPSENIKDVYISQERLCVVPRTQGFFDVLYYKHSISKFPESDNEVRQILGSLTSRDLVDVKTVKSGAATCFPIPGSGVAELRFDDGVYDVIVVDVTEAAAPINFGTVLIVVVVLVLIYVMFGGRFA